MSASFGVAALVAALVAVPASASAASDAVPGHYIVVLNDGVKDPAGIASEHGRRFGAQGSHVYVAALRGYAAAIPEARVDDVRNDSRVAYVVPDRRIEATAQNLPTGIDRIEGDVSSALSGNGSGSVAGVGIAIIDSGISAHPDLNIAGGKSCDKQSKNSYADGTGHGTHVAGTAAARDDGAGFVGMAPGAPLFAVRVLNRYGSGTLSNAACGVDWVTANAAAKGIKVANMSLQWTQGDDGNCGNTNQDPLHKAICASVAKGVTYVVAAGNASDNFANRAPASYDEVLTTTAVADFDGRPGALFAGTSCRPQSSDDSAAEFTSYTTLGSPDAAHTIAGPGVCIESDAPGGTLAVKSGTSMASPAVAGTAALCIAAGPCAGIGPANVIAKLRNDAAARATADPTYGFFGDPRSPIGDRYSGDLVYAGGY